MKAFITENIVELDVRSVIDSGKDPFNIIMETIKTLQPSQTLKLINSFKPLPLIQLLGRQGFESDVETIDENLVITYFFKSDQVKTQKPELEIKATDNWDEIKLKFDGMMETIDVRDLEMPAPMLRILDELNQLKPGKALFVYHKRIPVYLLPELNERNFDYRIKEISNSEVQLIIFKS